MGEVITGPFASTRTNRGATTASQIYQQNSESPTDLAISPRLDTDGDEASDYDSMRRRMDIINSFEALYQRHGLKAVAELLIEITEGFKARQERQAQT